MYWLILLTEENPFISINIDISDTWYFYFIWGFGAKTFELTLKIMAFKCYFKWLVTHFIGSIYHYYQY